MDATQATQGRSAAAAARALVLVLLLCAGLVLAACGDPGTPELSSSPPAPSGRAAASPSDAASPGRTPLPAPTVAGTIAFARVTPTGCGFATGDLCVVRTDGTGLTRLAAGSFDEHPGGSGLYVIKADGSGLSRVPLRGRVCDPAWRPE